VVIETHGNHVELSNSILLDRERERNPVFFDKHPALVFRLEFSFGDFLGETGRSPLHGSENHTDSTLPLLPVQQLRRKWAERHTTNHSSQCNTPLIAATVTQAQAPQSSRTYNKKISG